MTRIHEDLEHRGIAQRAEILAISGPTAPTVMRALANRDFQLLAERFGLEGVSDSLAARIVDEYGTQILGV